MKSEITQLTKFSKVFYEKHKTEIKDIILFGSILKGKLNPNDIDILILFNKKIDKDLEYEFKQQTKIKNLEIISKTLLDPSFTAREGILFEGFSLINKKSISSEYGFESKGMFIYNTKKLNNTNKTKFYYALNGRRKFKGMADSLQAIKLSDNILLVSLDKISLAKEFFNHWSIEFKYVPSLIPERLSKPHLLSKIE